MSEHRVRGRRLRHRNSGPAILSRKHPDNPGSASQAASEVLVTEGYRDDALIIDKIACSPILPRVPRSV
jgi:hypothetical protein